MDVAFAGVVFDYGYIVCVAVDVVLLACYDVLLVVVTVDDAGVLAAACVDAWCFRNNFWIDDLAGFVYPVCDFYV